MAESKTTPVEGGWVIEEGKSETATPMYWCGCYVNAGKFFSRWSKISTQAFRFARKEDALSMRTDVENNDPDENTHRVAYHDWG